MTREELRDYVDEQRTLNNIPYHVYSVLVDGIDTLEQEPCEDAVSRREAIKKFTYNHKGERIPDYDCDNFPIQIDVKTVKEILRALPSVTPQQKMGRWLKSSIGGAKICSICQARMGLSNFKYCPNCGVKIQEVEE